MVGSMMFSKTSFTCWVMSLLLATVAVSVAQRKSQRILSSPDIPVTGFSCSGRPPGYYADVETGCQVYHMCAEGGQQFSYKCPNTTLFQQRMLICAHWYQVNCSRSESHYGANLLIGQRDKPFVNENEDNYYINKKQVTNLTNPEILQHLSPSSFRQPKAQSNDVPVNHFDKFNLKRNDSPLVGNVGVVKQNPGTSLESSTIVPSSQKWDSSFVTFPTLKTTQMAILKNAFNIEITKTPQIQTSTTENPPVQFLPETKELNANFVPPPLIMEKAETTHGVSNSPAGLSATVKFQSSRNSELTPIPTDAVEQTQYPDLPVDEYNVFINRFNPNDEYHTTTVKAIETTEYYTFIDRFNPNQDGSDPLSGMIDSEQQQSRPNQVHIIKVPPFELEPPFQDSDESDTNQIELHFQDPRRKFFIPDTGSGELPNSEDVPIVVTIPLHSASDTPRMWFRTDKSKDPCARCHPSFIVNKNNCMPCVIIR